MYYSKYYPQVWSDVLEKLEKNEPLLRLCAAHWKAEHIISNCLQAIIEGDRKERKKAGAAQPTNDSDFEDDHEDVDMEPEVQPKGRKRAPEESLEHADRKKKTKVKRGTAAPVSTRNGQ